MAKKFRTKSLKRAVALTIATSVSASSIALANPVFTRVGTSAYDEIHASLLQEFNTRTDGNVEVISPSGGITVNLNDGQEETLKLNAEIKIVLEDEKFASSVTSGEAIKTWFNHDSSDLADLFDGDFVATTTTSAATTGDLVNTSTLIVQLEGTFSSLALENLFDENLFDASGSNNLEVNIDIPYDKIVGGTTDNNLSTSFNITVVLKEVSQPKVKTVEATLKGSDIFARDTGAIPNNTTVTITLDDSNKFAEDAFSVDGVNGVNDDITGWFKLAAPEEATGGTRNGASLAAMFGTGAGEVFKATAFVENDGSLTVTLTGTLASGVNEPFEIELDNSKIGSTYVVNADTVDFTATATGTVTIVDAQTAVNSVAEAINDLADIAELTVDDLTDDGKKASAIGSYLRNNEAVKSAMEGKDVVLQVVWNTAVNNVWEVKVYKNSYESGVYADANVTVLSWVSSGLESPTTGDFKINNIDLNEGDTLTANRIRAAISIDDGSNFKNNEIAIIDNIAFKSVYAKSDANREHNLLDIAVAAGEYVVLFDANAVPLVSAAAPGLELTFNVTIDGVAPVVDPEVTARDFSVANEILVDGAPLLAQDINITVTTDTSIKAENISITKVYAAGDASKTDILDDNVPDGEYVVVFNVAAESGVNAAATGLELTFTVTNETTVDTAALEEAIEEATKLLEDTKTSTDGADIPSTEYWATSADIAKFRDAIDAAKAVSVDQGADQDKVDGAVYDLKDAIDEFKDARDLGSIEAIALGVNIVLPTEAVSGATENTDLRLSFKLTVTNNEEVNE